MTQATALDLQLELTRCQLDLRAGRPVVGERRSRHARVLAAAQAMLAGRPARLDGPADLESTFTDLVAQLRESRHGAELVELFNAALERAVRPVSERAGGGR